MTAASKNDIRAWLKASKAGGATHMIVACDGFDQSDYPVDVMPDENVHAREAAIRSTSMQRVMEVYSHALDHELQLAEHRAFHY